MPDYAAYGESYLPIVIIENYPHVFHDGSFRRADDVVIDGERLSRVAPGPVALTTNGLVYDAHYVTPSGHKTVRTMRIAAIVIAPGGKCSTFAIDGPFIRKLGTSWDDPGFRFVDDADVDVP